MAKIKVIRNDNTIGYISEKGNITQFFEDAKEYRTILTAARSARIYLYNSPLIIDVRVVDENNKEYYLF